MPALEMFHTDVNLRVAIHRNLVVVLWSDAPVAGQITTAGRAMIAANTRYRSDFAIVNLVVSGTPRFDDQVRQELVKVLADPRVRGRGAAHAVTVEGLAGVAARAFLNTGFLLAREQEMNRAFSTQRDAARWLVDRFAGSKETWTAAAIEEACWATGSPRSP